MSQSIEEFQQEHGRILGQIFGQPAFNAAIVFMSLKAMDEIVQLTDEQIRNDASIILADLRGRLKYEKNLQSLPVYQEPFTDELQEEYVNGQDEHFNEHNNHASRR